jgi:hypothetical protein
MHHVPGRGRRVRIEVGDCRRSLDRHGMDSGRSEVCGLVGRLPPGVSVLSDESCRASSRAGYVQCWRILAVFQALGTDGEAGVRPEPLCMNATSRHNAPDEHRCCSGRSCAGMGSETDR